MPYRTKKILKVYENNKLIKAILLYSEKIYNIYIKNKNKTIDEIIEILKRNNEYNELDTNIKLISNITSSASGSFVYLYSHKNKNYIIKIAGYKTLFSKIIINNVIVENKIYNYLNLLYFMDVCPHFFYNYSATGFINNKNELSRLMLFNETRTSYENITNLLDTINKYINNVQFMNIVLPILLFQIIYTLECFSRMKLKHNDLHLGNIMILIDKKNILQSDFNVEEYTKYIIPHRTDNDFFGDNNDYYNLWKSKNKDNGDKEYIIPNIGFKVRIYDFDRSILYNENNKPIIYDNKIYNTKKNHKNHKHLIYNYDLTLNMNTIPCDLVDITKVLSALYNEKIIDTSITIQKIYDTLYIKLYKSFFKKSNVDNYNYVNLSVYNTISYRPYDMIYLNDYEIHNPNNLEILNFFDSTNKNVTKVYDMKNINIYWNNALKIIINKYSSKYSNLFSLLKNLKKNNKFNTITTDITTYKFPDFLETHIKYNKKLLSQYLNESTIHNNNAYITSNNEIDKFIIPIIIL